MQDWIRYVQENAESVAENAGADSAIASTREVEVPPQNAANSAAVPDAPAPAEDVSRRVAATLRTRRAAAPPGETSPERSESTPRSTPSIPSATRRRQRVETRAQLLERLTNPTITLHETSVILGVCSATVRRLTDCGELPHERTEGGQRRFRLMEVLKFQRDQREAKTARREAKNAK